LRKALSIVLGLVVLIVGALLVAAALQPDEYRIERTARTSAPPERVFAVVSDLGRFPEWSPWEALDPGMKRTFAGPPAAVGSSYAWDGNEEVGAGRMTIVAIAPGERVDLRLDFLRPYPSTSTAAWAVKPAPGGGSDVTWSMVGTNDGLGAKLFSMLAADRLLGGYFERGLASLKGVVEKG
jgi:uncharacterized protein YndB with AHSA1/START domain